MNGVLRTQLSGVARRPARLLLTGLAMLVASFVVYATVLAQSITERTVLDNMSQTPAAVDFVLKGGSPNTAALAKAAAVPGVAEAAGRVDVGGQLGSEYLNVTADPGAGPLSTVQLKQGRYPAGPGEIAVTPRTAERLGLPVGSPVSLTLGYTDDGKPKPPVKLTVVGLVTAGQDRGEDAYAPQPTITAATGQDYLSQIDVRLAPGASPEKVRSALDAIVAALPKVDGSSDKGGVFTGAQVRTDEAKSVTDDIGQLFAVVAMFVAIALAAAALVATSTFRIVFAQRMRQLALLRTVGAGRGSITRALAIEGALTGLVAGVTGVLGAIAAGFLVHPVAALFGTAVSAPGLPVPQALGVVALSVVITVLAVLAPARSASKVSPLEALRAAGTTGGRRDIGALRWLTGLVLAAGAGLIVAYVWSKLPGPDPKDYDPTKPLLAIVASGTLAYFALVSLGPVLVRPLLAVVGWPLRRLGPVGRLAVGGVGGAPRRAAAVSVVVALGVTLIAGVVVGGASIRVLANAQAAQAAPADYEVTANAGTPVTPAMVDQARASADLTRVVPYRRVKEVTITVADSQTEATDLDLASVPLLANVPPRSGSLADLGPGTVAISSFTADIAHLAVGDTAPVHAGKATVPLKVVAVFQNSAPLSSGLLVTSGDLTKLGAPAGYSGMLADAAKPGETGRTAGRQALKQITGNTDGLGLSVLADGRDEINKGVDSVLAVAIGLVGLTVLIAVVGVGTTSALSVVERVRESGLLRAVGLSRGGLRMMLTAESALYGVIGAAVGLLLGVPYAWLSVKALGERLSLELPVGQLAVVFVALVAFTALAGVLPARRAARVSPVAALGVDG